jgi:hypothetical protein
MKALLALLTAGMILAAADTALAQVKATTKKAPNTLCNLCAAKGCGCANNQCVDCPRNLKMKTGKGAN